MVLEKCYYLFVAKETVYTKHAFDMLNFRRISRGDVGNCIKEPYKISLGMKDRKIYYRKIGKKVLKVIVSENEKIVVITCHWIASDRIKL